MTDEPLPNTDAARAREGMIDELKTINKYEEMADEAEDPKVADTLREVADDERVHVGNFGALVAAEDSKAVPKMMEGIQETAKDTGLKFKGIDRLIQNNVDTRITKSDGGYPFRKARNQISLPEGYMYDDDGRVVPVSGRIVATQDELDRVQATVDSYLSRMRELRPLVQGMTNIHQKVDSRELIRDLIDIDVYDLNLMEPTLRKVDPSEVEYIKNVLKNTPEFKQKDYGTRTLILKALDEARYTNSNIIKEYERIRRGKEQLEQISEQIKNGMYEVSPSEDQSVMAQAGVLNDEAEAILAELNKFNKLSVGDAISYVEDPETHVGVEFNNQGELVAALMEDPGRYIWHFRADSPIAEKLVELISGYKSKIRDAKELVRRHKNLKSEAQRQRKNALAPKRERIEVYLNNLKALDLMAQADPNSIKEHIEHNAGDLPAEVETLLDNGMADEITELSELYNISLNDATESVLRRYYTYLANQYTDVVDYLQAQADNNWDNIGTELKKRLVENGMYDERNWARWSKDGASYVADNRYKHNPYGYEMKEGLIDDLIATMPKLKDDRPVPGSKYAPSSQRWMQGISNALWSGHYPKLYKENELPSAVQAETRFPSYTLFSNNKENIDAFGALAKLGIENVGQLREFASRWRAAANADFNSWPDRRPPGGDWEGAKKKLKSSVIDAWIADKKLNTSPEDREFIDNNLLGLGYASTNSAINRLMMQIESLPDDMSLKTRMVTHPPLSRDSRGDYESWIEDNFTKTSPYIYKLVVKPLWDAISDAYRNLANPDPAVRQNELRKISSVITDFIENSTVGRYNVRYDLKSSPVGAQIVEFINNVANNVLTQAQNDEDRQFGELVLRLGNDLKARLIRKVYGMAFTAQSPDRVEEAKAIAEENYPRVMRLLNSDVKYPGVVRKALEDMKFDFDMVLENDVEGRDNQAEYDAVDRLLSKNFTTYGQDLLEGLESIAGPDGKVDMNRYNTYDISPESFDALAKAIASNKKLSKRYADVLSEIDPELSELLRANIPKEDLIDDIKKSLLTTASLYPHNMRQWFSEYGGNAGAKTHRLNHAAELYLIAGTGGESGKIGAKRGTVIGTGMGGTGLTAVESERLYDEIKGIKNNPIKGYMTEVKDEDKDKDEVAISNDEYISRRTNAVLNTLMKLDNPLYGAMVLPSGNGMDEAAIITPAQLGYDEQKLASKPIDDKTIKDILDGMHKLGAITRMDIKDETDAYYKVGDLIAATRGEGRDLRDHIPLSEDLEGYPTDVLQETEDQIDSDKGLGFTVSPESKLQNETDIEYKNAVSDLNQAELLELEADKLENDPAYAEAKFGKLKGKYGDVKIEDNAEERANVLEGHRRKMANREDILDSARRQLKGRASRNERASEAAEEMRNTHNRKIQGKIQKMKEEGKDTSDLEEHILPPMSEEKKDAEVKQIEDMKAVASGKLIPTEKIGVKEFDDVVDALNIPQAAFEAVQNAVAQKQQEDVRTNPPEITEEALASAKEHNNKINHDRGVAMQSKRELARKLRDDVMGRGIKFKTEDPTHSGDFRSKVQDKDLSEISTQDLNNMQITRSASSQKTERPPLRVERVFSQAIPFYGIKLDLNANEPFDAAKYKTVKKEVQGSKRTNIDSLIAGRQKQ